MRDFELNQSGSFSQALLTDNASKTCYKLIFMELRVIPTLEFSFIRNVCYEIVLDFKNQNPVDIRSLYPNTAVVSKIGVRMCRKHLG